VTDQAHAPVMATEVVELLGERGVVIDMTVGAGGHAAALLDAGVGRIVGVDRDVDALDVAAARLREYGARVRLVRQLFSEIDLEAIGQPADGILFDLGVSSMQLDQADRGFSFRQDAPLDMRMAGERDDEPTAADLVNHLPERELADLLYRFGDERKSRQIAAAIVRQRPITTTDQLAGIVVGAVGRRPGGPHPARRTFQALRIAVNRELEELTASLPHAAGLLGPGGRVVVISYHSLEDGIVKRAFREDPSLRVLTKKPLVASTQERSQNPRARSAKLRAAERLGEAA
jgi:16S rRNA (cytosine1402-N4)-methyltransferase